jgi:hypothetical protein
MIDRKIVRDILNGEYKQQEIANALNFTYCKVCGNWDFADEVSPDLYGNYHCPFCLYTVLKENIILPFERE